MLSKTRPIRGSDHGGLSFVMGWGQVTVRPRPYSSSIINWDKKKPYSYTRTLFVTFKHNFSDSSVTNLGCWYNKHVVGRRRTQGIKAPTLTELA